MQHMHIKIVYLGDGLLNHPIQSRLNRDYHRKLLENDNEVLSSLVRYEQLLESHARVLGSRIEVLARPK